MANVVYADPFGSYVKGQEAGQQQAINLGEAQRRFRAEDEEHEFRKWYDPHRRDEVLMREQQQQMQTNQEHLQILASMVGTGNPQAQKIFADFVEQAVPGLKLDFSNLTPDQSAWIAGIASGKIPLALTNRDVFAAGPGTVQKYGHMDMGGVLGGTPPPNALFGNNADWLGGSGAQNITAPQATTTSSPGATTALPGTTTAPQKPFWADGTTPAPAPVAPTVPQPPGVFPATPTGGLYRPGNVMDNPSLRGIEAGKPTQYGIAPSERPVEVEQGSEGGFETPTEVGYSSDVNVPPKAPTQYGRPSVTVGAPITVPKSVIPPWVNKPTPGESPFMQNGTERVRGPVRRMETQ